MGITWSEFVSSYSDVLLRIQKTYGVNNVSLRFSLSDMEKYLSKNTSETTSIEYYTVFSFTCYVKHDCFELMK